MKKKFSGLGNLFKGFNELRAVTFSAGINQVEHFMKLIGSPQQVTADFVVGEFFCQLI